MDETIQTSSSAPSSPETVSRSGSVRRRTWVIAALLLLTVSTVIAFNQSPKADPFQSLSFFEWWNTPVERNSHKRLSEIKCNLNAIYALPDGQNVWAVGNLGMIVHSADAGNTWTQQKIVIQPTPIQTPTSAKIPQRPSNSQDRNINRPVQPSRPRAANEGDLLKKNLGQSTDSAAFVWNAGWRLNEQASPAMQSDSKQKQSTVSVFTGVALEEVPLPGGKSSIKESSGAEVVLYNYPDVTDTTDDNGIFRLKFLSGMEPGTSIRVVISKKGYLTASFYTTVGLEKMPEFRLRLDPKASAGPPTSIPTPSPSGSPTPTVTPGATTTPTPTPIPQPTELISKEDLIAVHFADARLGWTLNRLGELFATTDGGDNWAMQPNAVSGISENAPLRSAQLDSDGQIVLFVSESGLLQVQLKSQQLLYFSETSPGASRLSAGYVLTGQLLALAVGERGLLYQRDSTKDFSTQLEGVTENLNAVFADRNRYWIASDNGTILSSTHSSAGIIPNLPWRRLRRSTDSALRAIHFLPDGRRGYVAGANGVILGTEDGGEHWSRLLVENNLTSLAATGNYSRWPAPWYYLSCGIVLLLLWPALKRRPEDNAVAKSSIEEHGTSDRPIDKDDYDPLDFHSLALSLSRFLRNEKTLPPLTIAITGEWGTGKSSLMNLLRADLEKYKFRPVWFNAWHHQKEENLLASLLQNVRLQAVPSWWTPTGFWLRLHLLRIRSLKHRTLVLTLLFAFSFSASWVAYHPNAANNLWQAVTNPVNAGEQQQDRKQNESKPSTVSATISSGNARQKGVANSESQQEKPKDSWLTVLTRLVVAFAGEKSLLALLVSSLGVIAPALRSMKAFGVNPASLLATMSGGTKLRDLDAQTSFRQKFATEFQDVTKALGSRSMPIFIDDLDRCRPENVLEVLEAINFLVSSGDCFVVMGMARERVERCVGLSFRTVAHEMINLEDKTFGQTPAEQAREQRRQFARQYLDKLINIEVPVPAPHNEQALSLMLPQHKSKKSSRLSKAWRTTKTLTQKYAMAALILIVIYFGYMKGRSWEQQWGEANPQPVATHFDNTASLPVTPFLSPAPAKPVSNPKPLAKQPATNVSQKVIPPAEHPGQQAALILPPPLPRWPSPWPSTLMAAVLIGLAISHFAREREFIVKDSPEFKLALEIWYPAIYAGQGTPRSIKRFMNRVRYLAMRQRPYHEEQSRWKKTISTLVQRFRFKLPEPPMLDPNEPISATGLPAEELGAPISEETLVALAAVHHSLSNSRFSESYKEWLFDPSRMMPEGKNKKEKELLGALEKCINAHAEKFGSWKQVGTYQERFLKMAADVRVH